VPEEVPVRERIPSSSSTSFAPFVPSSVLVVPFRLRLSVIPGFQTTVRSSTVSRTERLSAVNFPEPGRYSRRREAVEMTMEPAAESTVNSVTGRSLLMKTSDARSSNAPPAAHSILRRRSVRTVNLASPLTTTADGFATGLAGRSSGGRGTSVAPDVVVAPAWTNSVSATARSAAALAVISSSAPRWR
jgi:hypothetical protein